MSTSSNFQSSPNSPMCLPLLKFSYATVAMDSVAPVPWTHISSKNNLFALFESARTRAIDGSVEERKRFKVLRDPEVMEELDLEILAHEAQQAIAISKDAKQHNRDQNVAVIVKAPVIAMKYPMVGGQVRRFQIRFASDEYYYDAMKMLSRAQVPTIEAGTFPPRPQTAASAPSRPEPEDGHIVLQHLAPRPITAAPVLDAAHSIVTPSISLHQMNSIDQYAGMAAASMKPRPKPLVCQRDESEHAGTLLQSGGIRNTDARDMKSIAQGPESKAQAQMPASIDLYMACPSTAPATNSQHLSQLLPQRRELPFEKPDSELQSASTRTLRSSTRDLELSRKTNEKEAAEKNKKASGSKAKSTSAVSRTSGQKRQRASAKKNQNGDGDVQPVAKRSRENHSIAAQQVAPKDQVPTIEELWRESRLGDQDCSKTLDTQALLLRAEALNRPKGTPYWPNLIQPPTSVLKNQPDPISKPTSLQVEIPASATSAQSHSPSKPATAGFPCTPANQMINPAILAAPAAQHVIDATADPISESGAPSNITSAVSTLLRNPLFANSDAKLAAWAALPDEKQHEALQTWICEQYEDRESNGAFLQLCKVFEKSWEASIVWPEVYKRS